MKIRLALEIELPDNEASEMLYVELQRQAARMVQGLPDTKMAWHREQGKEFLTSTGEGT